MLKMRKQGKGGFTLVELLTVLAIGAVLVAFAVPAISNLGLFARDELKGSARDMLALLQAARIYASTYNVNTAVVYSLDNYASLDQDLDNTSGLGSPVVDSITGQTLRVAVGAAILYELPSKSTPYKGGYVPVPGEEGIFRRLQGGMVIPLEYSPRLAADIPLTDAVNYASPNPRVNRTDASLPELRTLGLNVVPTYPDGFGPLAEPGAADPDAPISSEQQVNLNGNLNPDLNDPNDPQNIEYLPAHVFNPNGQLVGSFSKERFRFFIVPPPDLDSAERLDAEGYLLNVPLEITRASGRVRIASEG